MHLCFHEFLNNDDGKISDFRLRVEDLIALCMFIAAYVIADYRPPTANQSHTICQKTENRSTVIGIP
jgi:hypothetical protein